MDDRRGSGSEELLIVSTNVVSRLGAGMSLPLPVLPFLATFNRSFHYGIEEIHCATWTTAEKVEVKVKNCQSSRRMLCLD